MDAPKKEMHKKFDGFIGAIKKDTNVVVEFGLGFHMIELKHLTILMFPWGDDIEISLCTAHDHETERYDNQQKALRRIKNLIGSTIHS